MRLKFSILTCIILFKVLPALSQDTNPNRLQILHADLLTFKKGKETSVQKLIGDVRIRQDSTFFYCDSAYLYEEENKIMAYSNVKIDMPDGVTLLGDRLRYDGQKRIAYVYDNITLTDQAVTLTTDFLTYFRDKKIGQYINGGMLEDGDNILTSDRGYYYSDLDKAYFKKNVELDNPDYVLRTDTMGYNTETEIVNFVDTTFIDGDEGSLITSLGTYDTGGKIMRLFSRSVVQDSSYVLTADTLYYDDNTFIGEAMGNVIIEQADSSIKVLGEFGIFNRATDETTVTDNAVAIQFMEDDTLYMLADTLYSMTDSLDNRLFRAHYDVKVFMNEMQGKSDSLVYQFSDSLIYLYSDPILWSNVNQLTGDTVLIQLRGGQADSMWIGPKGFIVSEEDTVGYNQIKGKEIRANFRDNQLYKLHVIGNSESIYFAKNDEEDGYEGMNQALAQEMFIYLDSSQVSKIHFNSKPDGSFLPMHEILFKENVLDGMRWRIKEKPEKPEIDLAAITRIFNSFMPQENIESEEENSFDDLDPKWHKISDEQRKRLILGEKKKKEGPQPKP